MSVAVDLVKQGNRVKSTHDLVCNGCVREIAGNWGENPSFWQFLKDIVTIGGLCSSRLRQLLQQVWRCGFDLQGDCNIGQ